MSVPATVGGKSEPTLVGHTTLEIVGFKVNPVTGRLEKATAIEHEAKP